MSENDVKEYSGEWWANEILACEKEMNQKWRDSGAKVIKRYLDIRDDGYPGDGSGEETRKYNIFWANVQILKSALYAQAPSPLVKRQFDDAKDDISRCAALILQRMLDFGLKGPQNDMHRAFGRATEDRLLPGLGQVWLRMEVETEKKTIPAVMNEFWQEIVPSSDYEEIVNQQVITDYVNWNDFFWSPARTWEEVWWVGRRVWMKKKAFIQRFGQPKYDEIKELAKKPDENLQYPRGFEKGRVEVIEVWCEDTNKVYFIHVGLKAVLEEKEDPLKLKKFWPCPPPLLATHTTNDLCPRADFVMVQDQYQELDTLNNRINVLTKALRVVGAYDSQNTELQKMLTGPEFAMIPVEKWAMLAEAGGMTKAVDWFPVEQVSKVLRECTEQRALLVQQIYELTSIGDIMRGVSNPRDTLGAQKLKAQYSSVRLRLTQQDVSLFVCEAMRIKAEIIAKHYDPMQLRKQSLIDMTESAQFADAAIEMLRDFEMLQYHVEITEESLSMADYTAEREMRIAYLTAVGQFLSQAAQMVVNMPASLPYIIKLITWVTASFRGADDIESVLDEAAKMAMANPMLPPGKSGEGQNKDPEAEAGAKAKSQIAIDNNELKNDLTRIKAEGIKDILTQPEGTPNGRSPGQDANLPQ